MAHVDAVFEFRVGALMIRSDLIGQRLVVPGSSMWIEFPNGTDIESPYFCSGRTYQGWNESTDDGERLALGATVVVMGEPVEADLDPANPDEESVRQVLGDARPRVRTAFGRLAS